MKSSKIVPLLVCFLGTSGFAVDGPKVKVLDKCDQIDPKTTVLHEVKAKAVSTPDPEHRKAIELTIDYAKAGSYPSYVKTFPLGLMNPAKYSAVRFYVRGNSSTGFSVQLNRKTARGDDKLGWFSGASIVATETWTQVTVPLENFKRGGGKIWKNGAQLVLPGGDPMDADDIASVGEFRFVTVIDRRGTAAVGHLMFDAVELVEK